jgi:arsenite methyltransferase
MALHVGCVAGASQIAEYEEYLGQAGFQGIYMNFCSDPVMYIDLTLDVLIVDAMADLNLYKESSYLQQSTCCGDSSKVMPGFSDINFNEWVGKLSF